jgi:soluble lytic murein transglycosylase-like protein
MADRRRTSGRAALTRLAAALALALAAPAAGQGVEHWSAEIAEASARFGVPEGWIRRVMQAESGGNVMMDGRPITSRAGAMGLMQLMPGTWAEMRQAYGLGPDPYAPRDNILAGAAYLRSMYDRFGYPGLFAVYNAGPNLYARHLATGAALPAETVAYLQKVSGGRDSGSAMVASPTTVAASAAELFAVRRAPAAHAEADAAPRAADGLFAVRPAPRE